MVIGDATQTAEHANQPKSKKSVRTRCNWQFSPQSLPLTRPSSSAVSYDKQVTLVCASSIVGDS